MKPPAQVLFERGRAAFGTDNDKTSSPIECENLQIRERLSTLITTPDTDDRKRRQYGFLPSGTGLNAAHASPVCEQSHLLYGPIRQNQQNEQPGTTMRRWAGKARTIFKAFQGSVAIIAIQPLATTPGPVALERCRPSNDRQ